MHASIALSGGDVSPPAQPDRFLRLDQVKDIVGLGRTMIYQLITTNDFPRPIKIGANASRWSEQQLFVWLAEQRERVAH